MSAYGLRPKPTYVNYPPPKRAVLSKSVGPPNSY